MITGYEITRSDSSSGGRWHLAALIDEWPHRVFVRKFPTKRAATAIRDMMEARAAPFETAQVFLRDEVRSWGRRGFSEAVAREQAATSLRSILTAAGVPQPDWWLEWATEEKRAIDALK